MAAMALARPVEQRWFHFELLVNHVDKGQQNGGHDEVVAGPVVVIRNQETKDQNAANGVDANDPPLVAIVGGPLHLRVNRLGDV